LKLCFLGRLDPTKGVDVLLSALRVLPLAPLTLDIFGVAQGGAGDAYVARLHQAAEHDARITFHASVPADQVLPTIREYDLLAVPSQGLETGPLVVLEAFAAGTPVIGSASGGIAELVRDGHTGWLVPASETSAWTRALQYLIEAPSALTAARAAIAQDRVRCMANVAVETCNLYNTIFAKEPFRTGISKQWPTAKKIRVPE
jgi:glycosyltransferase involved in cell wall biosynthesis